MGEHHHLIGADDVRSAGNAMRHAAEDMKSAASTIDAALDQHRNFLNDWLQRFEAAVDRIPKTEMQLRRERANAFADDYLPSMAKG